LPKLLADLKNQTDKDFEVIITDGRSEDNTRSISVRENQDLNLHFYEAEKRGVSHQRNYGAGFAKGKFLVFLDADVRLSPHFIAKLKKETTKHKYLIFLPKYISAERFVQDPVINKTIFDLMNFLIEASHYTKKPFSIGATIIFEQNYFHYLGGFNEQFIVQEDHEIISRAKKFGVNAKFLKNIAIRVSLRRFKREGRLNVLRDYLIATVSMLWTKNAGKKMFNYEMGGAQYNFVKKPRKTVTAMIKKYFDWMIAKAV